MRVLGFYLGPFEVVNEVKFGFVDSVLFCDVFAGFLFSGFDGFRFLLAYVCRTVKQSGN